MPMNLSPSHRDLTPEELESALEQIFGEMSDDEIAQTLAEFEELENKLKIAGPTNPDELHQWAKDEIGIDIPRTKVCEDHDAPFWFFADLFFEDEIVDWPEPDGTKRTYGGIGSALLMANRGGGKTFLVALLHYANSEFKPGCESITFGATRYQSKRCYDHLTPWVTHIVEIKGEKRKRPKPGVEDTQKSETIWEPVRTGIRGSKVEILSGTEESVNGPHPNVAHADEVEQMKQGAWEESRNMAIAGKDAYGRKIKPRNICTSTRKSMHGRMQSLINSIRDAESKGMRPPYKLYQYCIFETAEQRSDCREAPENVNRDPDELCKCNVIPSGVWPDGTDRTLDQVCQGRFFKSRGWQPPEQVEELFIQNVRVVWEAQQECRKPETQDNYLQWDEANDCILDWDPRPEFGIIVEGIDWGAGNPNAVNLYQILNQDVEALSFSGDEWVLLPAGCWVVFDEIYEAQIGAGRLANKVIAMEQKWKNTHGKMWRIHGRFADVAGRQQRLDFLDAGLPTGWNATRDFEYHVEQVQWLHERGRVKCCYDTAPMFNVEAGSWRANPQTGREIEERNHCMANFRYAVVNMHRRDQVAKKRQGQARSHRTRKKMTTGRARGPLGLSGQERSPVEAEFGVLS